MNLKNLESYIDAKNYNLDFETDGIGWTWGVSYVRLTVGQKSKFETLEHFFFSTIMSNKNITSSINGKLNWIDNTDLKEWAKNLNVRQIKPEELNLFIVSSLHDINENLKYWTAENCIDTSFLDASKEYDNCFLVNETISPRNYINTTDVYLTSDNNHYYCFEGHWES